MRDWAGGHPVPTRRLAPLRVRRARRAGHHERAARHRSAVPRRRHGRHGQLRRRQLHRREGDTEVPEDLQEGVHRQNQGFLREVRR